MLLCGVVSVVVVVVTPFVHQTKFQSLNFKEAGYICYIVPQEEACRVELRLSKTTFL